MNLKGIKDQLFLQIDPLLIPNKFCYQEIHKRNNLENEGNKHSQVEVQGSSRWTIYLKFFLNVSGSQGPALSGYNNTLEIKAVEQGDAPQKGIKV